MDIFDRTFVPISFKDNKKGVIALQDGCLIYTPVSDIDKGRGYLNLDKAEDRFLNYGYGDAFLKFPRETGPMVRGFSLRIHDEELPYMFEVRHADPSINISRDAKRVICSVFMMAQLFNDLSIFADSYREDKVTKLVIPLDFYSFSNLTCDSNLKYPDEYLHVIEGHYENNYLRNITPKGEYMMNGGRLFTLEPSFDYNSLFGKTMAQRYILKAYEQIDDDECLGVKYAPDGRGTLLAASVDGGIKMRKIPGFNVYPLMRHCEPPAPFFIIDGGEFKGSDKFSTYEAPEPKDGDYLPLFIDWASGGDNLFRKPGR